MARERHGGGPAGLCEQGDGQAAGGSGGNGWHGGELDDVLGWVNGPQVRLP